MLEFVESTKRFVAAAIPGIYSRSLKLIPYVFCDSWRACITFIAQIAMQTTSPVSLSIPSEVVLPTKLNNRVTQANKKVLQATLRLDDAADRG